MHDLAMAFVRAGQNLAVMFQWPCGSLQYFPEGILADDLSLSELKQVNSSHCDGHLLAHWDLHVRGLIEKD